MLCLWAFRAKGSSTAERQADQMQKIELLENELKYGLVNDNLALDGETAVINRDKEELLLKNVTGGQTKLFIRIVDTYCEE
jgi:hypothetical protein